MFYDRCKGKKMWPTYSVETSLLLLWLKIHGANGSYIDSQWGDDGWRRGGSPALARVTRVITWKAS